MITDQGSLEDGSHLDGSCTELLFELFPAPRFGLIALAVLRFFSNVMCIWSDRSPDIYLGSFYFCKVQNKNMTSLGNI